MLGAPPFGCSERDEDRAAAGQVQAQPAVADADPVRAPRPKVPATVDGGPGFSTEAVQAPARVNVTWVTPLGEEVASTW